MNRQQIAIAGIITPLLLLAGLYLSAADAFDPNLQPVGYVAQPAITNFNLTSDNERLFRTDYDRADWSGDLLAVPVTAQGVVVEAAEAWNGAAEHVDAQNFNTGRKIVTLKSDGNKVAFRWANLSTGAVSQQTDIGDATTGPKILNFVRGDRSNEKPNGASFRKRGSALGAIIHSTPRYVDYGTYQRVFVGANDGMLHAFDAETGDEVFAYIPSMLIPNLKKLAVDPYVLQHYVDGNFSIGQVLIGVNKKVLVGGLGAGGKGLYAMDVTSANPATEADAAAMILWEKKASDPGLANLGYTYGTPQIARVKTGTGTWVDAVIVNNGYANSGNGKASLFVLNAATGALIREIVTGDAGTTAAPNGLSPVRLLDTDGDAIVDYAYAGDLDGAVWKFDLTSASATSWTASKLYTTSPAQAITVAPAVQVHPNGGYMVLFATGRALIPADVASTSNAIHYAYGIWDGAPDTNTTLVAQTLTEKIYSSGGVDTRVRTATSNQPDWSAGGDRGWRTPLPVAGERVLGEGTFFEGGRFYFTSTNPVVTNSSPPDGANWLVQLDYLTGGSPGMPFFNLNTDDVVTDADRINGSGGTVDMSPAGVPVAKYLQPGLASQPVLVSLVKLDTTLFTFNPDVILPPPVADRGVFGGHFDVDIYYVQIDSHGKAKDKNQHFHEYDDIFDVTGVDFLNASSPTLNLVNAIPSTATSFKVLAYNQYHNPAVQFSLGGAPYIEIRNYKDPTNPAKTLTSATFDITTLPIYTRANVTTMLFNLPLNAFDVKNWVPEDPDDIARAGVIPTQTKCVHDRRLGLLGERFNGAMAWQVVKSTTPQSALQLNVSGRPDLGWRVKDSLMSTYVLAEYTLFWHHPNGKCYGDAGWIDGEGLLPDTKPSDPNKNQTPATGSTDPKNGDFTAGAGGGTTTTTVNGNTTTIVTTYPDGGSRTEVRTTNPDGSTTVEITECGPGESGPACTTTTATVPPPGSYSGTGGLQSGSPFGRMSWRDL